MTIGKSSPHQNCDWFTIDVPFNEARNAMVWCVEVIGKDVNSRRWNWNIPSPQIGERIVTFYIRDSSDALAFKLKLGIQDGKSRT